MNRPIALLNLWFCICAAIAAGVDAFLADTTMERIAWLAALGGALMGIGLSATILSIQRIANRYRDQSEYWKQQAGRSGKELHRLAALRGVQR